MVLPGESYTQRKSLKLVLGDILLACSQTESEDSWSNYWNHLTNAFPEIIQGKDFFFRNLKSLSRTETPVCLYLFIKIIWRKRIMTCWYLKHLFLFRYFGKKKKKTPKNELLVVQFSRFFISWFLFFLSGWGFIFPMSYYLVIISISFRFYAFKFFVL